MAQFTNQAQLSYNNSVTNSNIAVGEILEVLSAKKTAVRTSYEQNGTVTYVISMVNSGTTPLNGLTITDNLGEYSSHCGSLTPLTYVPDAILYYVNGKIQNTPAVTTDPFTVTGINIPAGGSAVIVYEVKVNQYAPLGVKDRIVNRATISGDCITPVNVSETIKTTDAPLLSITKSISPIPVAENGRLTYTFVISNTGNTAVEECDLATVTDTFDPKLSDLTVTFNGTAWTSPTKYTYNENTGEFATVAGKITVPAATYKQNKKTGAWSVTPGTATLVVTGTV